MHEFPDQIVLISEAHKDRNSRYAFEDRLYTAPAILSYDWAVTLEEPLHRIYYTDDMHPTLDIERDTKGFGRLAEILTGSALIKIAIDRGWTTGGIWRTVHRTIALFDFEDDAGAFAAIHRTRHHPASFAEKWLSGD